MFVFGIRYVDDIILRVRDANASGPPEERRYYLTDANYNVVMRTDDSGRGVERMFYSAYGQPECFPFGDVDGDYDVDNDDATALTALIGTLVSSDVNILADLNLDGLITQADLNLLNTNNYMNHSGGANVLSVDSEANDVGYAGYVWNDETTQWHVRNRELSPKLGRWLQRDPMWYFDDLNLYQYVGGAPESWTDPSGLSKKLRRKPRKQIPRNYTRKRDCGDCPKGEEKTVIILGDVGSDYRIISFLSQAAWGNVCTRYQTEAERYDDTDQVIVYRNGVTIGQFQEIVTDKCVTRLILISHGTPDDEYEPEIYLNPAEPREYISPDIVKGWVDDCDSIKEVTIRACYQGAPRPSKKWKKAFNLEDNEFKGAPGQDRYWYWRTRAPSSCTLVPSSPVPTGDTPLPSTIPIFPSPYSNPPPPKKNIPKP